MYNGVNHVSVVGLGFSGAELIVVLSVAGLILFHSRINRDSVSGLILFHSRINRDSVSGLILFLKQD
jgi:hypothetical protein